MTAPRLRNVSQPPLTPAYETCARAHSLSAGARGDTHVDARVPTLAHTIHARDTWMSTSPALGSAMGSSLTTATSRKLAPTFCPQTALYVVGIRSRSVTACAHHARRDQGLVSARAGVAGPGSRLRARGGTPRKKRRAWTRAAAARRRAAWRRQPHAWRCIERLGAQRRPR